MATTRDGHTHRFRNATAFATWYLAAPRGLVQVTDVSAVPAENEPTPGGNRGPAGHQAH